MIAQHDTKGKQGKRDNLKANTGYVIYHAFYVTQGTKERFWHKQHGKLFDVYRKLFQTKSNESTKFYWP